MSKRKAVVLVSGGLDSATALAIAKAEGFECFALSVSYGQRHSSELAAAKRIAALSQVTEHRLMHVDLAGLGGSALTDDEIAVPEGPTTGIPATYVPARNTIMLALALAWAEVIQAEAVFIGVNALDYSVAGHTKVWIRSDGEPHLMRIDDVCSLPVGRYETIAADRRSLELRWKRITGRFRHSVAGKQCFRVRLERGQEIEISEDHSLFTIGQQGRIVPIKGSRIEVGMPLVTAFDLAEFAASWSRDLTHIDLRKVTIPAPFRTSVHEDRGALTNRLKRTRVPLDLPVTDDFLSVVGLWLAEGGKDPLSRAGSLAFSIGALDGGPELLRRYFEQFAIGLSRSPANNFDYRVHSSVACEMFRRLDLLATAKSGQKRFPAWFWSLSQRQRRVIVAALWDGDGCQVWRGEAPIHQKSHGLIRDLYHCLLLDGIFSSIKPARNEQLRLSLTRAADMARFAKLYSLRHASKRESLEHAGQRPSRDKTIGIWKFEGLWEAVASAALPVGRKTEIYNAGGKYDASVRAQRKAFVDVPALQPLVGSKLAFLRVVAIEPVAHEFMYDLAVEDDENFLADGFLAHNSGYPDCRPEYVEAFNRLAELATKTAVEGNPTRIEAPLIALSKADIIRRGVELGVDYALTVSCYQADEDGHACGRCDACRLRRRGFVEAGVPDPTRYQRTAPENT